MALDWLYGRRMAEYHDIHRAVLIRPLVLDMDTVVETADLATTAIRQTEEPDAPPATVHYTTTRDLTAAELENLSAADRASLNLSVRGTNTQVHISFAANHMPTIAATANGAGRVPREQQQAVTNARRHIETTLAEHLLRNGQPRPNWRKVLALLPTVAFAALLAAYIWLASTTELLPAAHALILILIGFTLAQTIRTTARLNKRAANGSLGHRIRNESRKETYARRADSHRDLKVAALSIVGTLIAAVIGAWLLGLLNLSPMNDTPGAPPPTPSSGP